MPAYLYNLFRQAMPDAGKAFIENHDGRIISFGDVEKGSAQLANVLVSLGVVPGDRVAVQVEKSPEAILLYLACLRAGAVFLPLNTAYTPAEISYFLGDSEPRVFVCDPTTKDKLAAVAKEAGVGAVETLGVKNDGTLAERMKAASTTFNDVALHIQRCVDPCAADLSHAWSLCGDQCVADGRRHHALPAEA